MPVLYITDITFSIHSVRSRYLVPQLLSSLNSGLLDMF